MKKSRKHKHCTVAMLGSLPPLRALSSYCLELSKAMAEICHVEFISFNKIYPEFLYPGGDLEEDHTYPDISMPGLKIKRRLNWYNPLTWLTEGLFSKGDILHAQWWSIPLFPIYLVICLCFKIRSRPVIFTVHNVLSHDNSRLYIFLSHILFKFGDHFIVHSETGFRQMLRHYHISPEKISIIPHGSLDFHVRKNVSRIALRKKLGFSETDKVILLFGAIRPYKGVDIALRALAEIHEHLPVKLLIAGKLWESWEPYERLIHELGIEYAVTTRLEYIPSGEVYEYFEASDLAIFPYRYFDSQSGAGATAISFKKPMIVTNTGGLPELVNDPRCIVPANDFHALARAIKDFFQNPEISDAVASKMNLISKKLSWKNIARQTQNVYINMLNRK